MIQLDPYWLKLMGQGLRSKFKAEEEVVGATSSEGTLDVRLHDADIYVEFCVDFHLHVFRLCSMLRNQAKRDVKAWSLTN